ncbi:MAG TPA: DUF58 domain-containing protein [Burkholderiales bacterium]
MKVLYRAFRHVYRVGRWVRRRLTPAGALAASVLALAMAFGPDTRQSNAYQVFALGFALLGLSIALSLARRPRFAARRILPPYATVGEPLDYTLEVTNQGRRDLRGAALRDHLEDAFPAYEAFRDARVPGDEKRNWFDRRVGYHRWEWLLRRARGGDVEEAALPVLAAGQSARARLRLTPRRRGVLRFAATALALPDPLGLCYALAYRAAPGELLVLPPRYPTRVRALEEARRYQPGGVAQASKVGDSEEFMALREYRPGDPLRRVHWRSWARTGRPVVKEYQDEYFVRSALVLDTFAGPQREAEFEAAVSVAASFAWAPRAADSMLDLVFVGDEAYTFTAGRGQLPTEGMLRILAAVQPSRDADFPRLARAVLGRARLLSGAVCVLLDWDPPRRDLVRRLRALQVPVEVLVVAEDSRPAPDPGPMADAPGSFHLLHPGRLREQLAAL